MELQISELIDDSLLDVSAKKINIVKREPEIVPPSILRYKNSLPKNKEKKRVSYDDILAKMGMYVDNGKLHVTEKNTSCGPSACGSQKIKCARLQQQIAQPQNTYQPNPSMQNSYIYNKYFKDQAQPVEQIAAPKTLEEYKQLLVKKALERRIQQIRIQQMKSTKLIMPTENINIKQEPRNQNRFFRF